jgi:hypothetical protein
MVACRWRAQAGAAGWIQSNDWALEIGMARKILPDGSKMVVGEVVEDQI